MKQKPATVNAETSADDNDPRLSFRLDQPIADRFLRVVKASKRSKTSIVEECLEKALPDLEKQYKKAA